MNKAAKQYLWRCGHPFGEKEIELGRILGRERKAMQGTCSIPKKKRIKIRMARPDGLHHLRIS